MYIAWLNHSVNLLGGGVGWGGEGGVHANRVYGNGLLLYMEVDVVG